MKQKTGKCALCDNEFPAEELVKVARGVKLCADCDEGITGEANLLLAQAKVTK